MTADPAATEDVELVALRLAGSALHLVVRGTGGQVCLVAAMPDAAASLLAHLYGAGAPRCPVPPHAHVDLLVSALHAAGATARLIVRRHGSPAFLLRVDAPAGSADLDLDVLDAVRLLTSRRLPIQLAPGADLDWDAVLRALTDAGGDVP